MIYFSWNLYYIQNYKTQVNLQTRILNGISYKPGVPYVDGSYALLVDHYIKEAGKTTIAIDPLASEMPSHEAKLGGVVLLAHPTPYLDYAEDTVFIDPWRKMKKNSKYLIIQYGNTR